MACALKGSGRPLPLVELGELLLEFLVDGVELLGLRGNERQQLLRDVPLGERVLVPLQELADLVAGVEQLVLGVDVLELEARQLVGEDLRRAVAGVLDLLIEDGAEKRDRPAQPGRVLEDRLHYRVCPVLGVPGGRGVNLVDARARLLERSLGVEVGVERQLPERLEHGVRLVEQLLDRALHVHREILPHGCGLEDVDRVESR